ncbi:MAG: hypothetical protein HFF29_02950 [Oscillospiraceae bacterium]|nr:hypothetical protein [Oscillospiraceae bacterium]
MNVKRILSVLCLGGALCLLCGCDFMDYQKASSLLDKGNYEEARAIYTQMEENGGYKDSAQMLEECDYVEAGAAYEAGDYARAMELYEGLGSYGDAPEQLAKVKYSCALQRKEDGDLGGAYALFAELGNYEDSAAMAQDCVARSWENPQVGDALFFGSFEQDTNESNGPEPIQWRVLAREGDRLLLTSEHLLRRMEYGGSSLWEDSDVRTWLNGEFYNAAFSQEEQGHIQKVYTYAKQNSDLKVDDLRMELAYAFPDDPEEAERVLREYISEFGDDGDHVFLLSAQEARDLFSGEYDRRSASTKAASTLGDTTNSRWWTRSRTSSGTNQVVVAVENDGEIDSVHPSHDSGVRPAICLNLSGQPSQEALDLKLFGFPSSTNLYDTATESEGYSRTPCLLCNGTGTIRFYYGSSDLEAILSGHDPYTLGTCPMCNGRG